MSHSYHTRANKQGPSITDLKQKQSYGALEHHCPIAKQPPANTNPERFDPTTTRSLVARAPTNCGFNYDNLIQQQDRGAFQAVGSDRRFIYYTAGRYGQNNPIHALGPGLPLGISASGRDYAKELYEVTWRDGIARLPGRLHSRFIKC